MNRRYTKAIVVTAIVYAAWSYFRTPVPTTISIRIGDTFEQVARSSNFPVAASSNIPTHDVLGSGSTSVKEPAVIIRFNDPKYGFTLPPTTFAFIGYMHNKVDTIATSPMLSMQSYEQAVDVVARLQNQFISGGWELDDDTTWFDLTREGRLALHNDIRLGNQGYRKEVSLRAPEKYSMTFRLRCAARCDNHIGFDRYLIDIGIAQDFEFAIQTRKRH
jgi:hypothetical protein